MEGWLCRLQHVGTRTARPNPYPPARRASGSIIIRDGCSYIAVCLRPSSPLSSHLFYLVCFSTGAHASSSSCCVNADFLRLNAHKGVILHRVLTALRSQKDVKPDRLFYTQHSGRCQRRPKDCFKKPPLVRVHIYENNGAVKSNFKD